MANKLLIYSLIFVILSFSTSAVYVNYSTFQDNEVDPSSPTTNVNPTSVSISTIKDGGANFVRSYMKFNISDIAAAGKTITDATLSLWMRDIFNGDYSNSVFAVYNLSWEEGVITWNSQPCGTAIPAVGAQCNVTAEASITPGATAGYWYKFNITPAMRYAYGIGSPVISLMIQPTANAAPYGVDRWGSREWTANPPYLNITYENTGSPAPPITPLGRPVLDLANNSIVSANRSFVASGVLNASGYTFLINGSLRQNTTSSTCSNCSFFMGDGFYNFTTFAWNAGGNGNSSFYYYKMDTNIYYTCITTQKACTSGYFTAGSWHCQIENIRDCSPCTTANNGANYTISECSTLECSSTCSIQGAYSCIGAYSVQRCLLSSDGCYYNYFAYPCDSGYYCSFGSCVILGSVSENISSDLNPDDFSSEYYSQEQIAARQTQGQKLFILLFVIGMIFAIIIYSGKLLKMEKFAFIMACISSVFVLLSATIPATPIIGGYLPFWVLIIFILFIVAIAAMFIPRGGQNEAD